MMKKLMIAGPNGAGKTTTTEQFSLQQDDLYDEFIKADHIQEVFLHCIQNVLILKQED